MKEYRCSLCYRSESNVFSTVVFLTFDLQILLTKLPTLWPEMVSLPISSTQESHTHPSIHSHLACTHTHACPHTGPEFEERIRLNEAGNPKFNFLALHDPYHAYYEHKIKEIREGVAQEAAAAPPPLMQQVRGKFDVAHCLRALRVGKWSSA